MGDLLDFPDRPKTYIFCFALNLWTVDGFWGTVGVYMDECDAHRDAERAMSIEQFVSFRIESVGFFPKGDV